MNIFERLAGYKTHIANVTSAAGTVLAAAGLNIPPETLTSIATSGLQTVDQAGQLVNALNGANWQQVGIGLGIALFGNVLSSVMRSLAAKPGTLAIVTGAADAIAAAGKQAQAQK